MRVLAAGNNLSTSLFVVPRIVVCESHAPFWCFVTLSCTWPCGGREFYTFILCRDIFTCKLVSRTFVNFETWFKKSHVQNCNRQNFTSLSLVINNNNQKCEYKPTRVQKYCAASDLIWPQAVGQRRQNQQRSNIKPGSTHYQWWRYAFPPS